MRILVAIVFSLLGALALVTVAMVAILLSGCAAPAPIAEAPTDPPTPPLEVLCQGAGGWVPCHSLPPKHPAAGRPSGG
jgi:hypothetical protein